MIVNGPPAAFGPWREALRRDYLPATLVLFIPGEATAGLPPPLAKPAGPAVNAWVCEGVTCLPPVADAGAIAGIAESPDNAGVPHRIQPSRLGEVRMKKSVSSSPPLGLAFAAAPAFASEELAKKNACTACHAIDKKLVGPSYKDVATKYKGNPRPRPC